MVLLINFFELLVDGVEIPDVVIVGATNCLYGIATRLDYPDLISL